MPDLCCAQDGTQGSAQARQTLHHPSCTPSPAPSSGFNEDLPCHFVFPELPPPNLNSSTNVVKMGQNVSLSCSSKKNASVDITYSLFWGTKHIETKTKRGETVIFHLKISNANETGPYKCKTNVSNLHKYSQELNFRIASKCLLPYSGDGGGRRGAEGRISGAVEGSSKHSRMWKGTGDVAHPFSPCCGLSLFFSYSAWALSVKDGAPTLERVFPAQLILCGSASLIS